MKKIYIISLLLVALFSACDDREIITIGDTVNPALTASVAGTSVVITNEMLDTKFTTFTWSAATFGFESIDANYTLQVDLKGSNFSQAVNYATTSALTVDIATAKLNQTLIALGAKVGEATDVEFRLIGKIHPDYSGTSNVVSVKITPLKVVIVYPKLYVSSQKNAWGFTETDLIYSVKSNNIYEGFAYLTPIAGNMGMKFSTVPEWGDGTGTIGDPVGAGTSGTLQVGSWGGNNIVIPAAEGTQAFFKIVANLNDLTYKITRTDWVITGDFNGWGLSTFLTFNPATELLTWTGDMTAGKYRFVANSWADNMGDKDNDGIIDIGEHNITLTEAGNYTVTLDLTGAIYTYTIKKN